MTWERLFSALDSAWGYIYFFTVICGIECVAITLSLFAGLAIRWSFSSIITYLQRKALNSYRY